MCVRRKGRREEESMLPVLGTRYQVGISSLLLVLYLDWERKRGGRGGRHHLRLPPLDPHPRFKLFFTKGNVLSFCHFCTCSSSSIWHKILIDPQSRYELTEDDDSNSSNTSSSSFSFCSPFLCSPLLSDQSHATLALPFLPPPFLYGLNTWSTATGREREERREGRGEGGPEK